MQKDDLKSSTVVVYLEKQGNGKSRWFFNAQIKQEDMNNYPLLFFGMKRFLINPRYWDNTTVLGKMSLLNSATILNRLLDNKLKKTKLQIYWGGGVGEELTFSSLDLKKDEPLRSAHFIIGDIRYLLH